MTKEEMIFELQEAIKIADEKGLSHASSFLQQKLNELYIPEGYSTWLPDMDKDLRKM